jgi:hypothetical protein
VIGLFAPVIDQLSRGLTYATARHLVLARNIANSETPGYRPRDLIFDDYLKVPPAWGRGSCRPIRDPRNSRQRGSSSRPTGRRATTAIPSTWTSRWRASPRTRSTRTRSCNCSPVSSPP